MAPAPGILQPEISPKSFASDQTATPISATMLVILAIDIHGAAIMQGTQVCAERNRRSCNSLSANR